MESTDTEEYEQIPWGELKLAPAPYWSLQRIVYLVAGVLAAIAVGSIAGRALLHSDPTPTTVAAPSPATTVPESVATPSTLAPPTLYSQADLMAVLPPSNVELAVAKSAEMYARTYFAASPGSYVEWVAADRVVSSEGGATYTVRVGIGLLAASTEDAYVRLPPIAVEIAMGFQGQDPVPLDIPSPLPPPSGQEAPPISGLEQAPIPPEFIAAVEALETGWTEIRVVQASRSTDLWRIEVEVGDNQEGLVWPMAVWFDSLGNRTSPPQPDTDWIEVDR